MAQQVVNAIPADSPAGVAARGITEQVAGMAPFMTGGIPGMASSLSGRLLAEPEVAAAGREAATAQEAGNLAERQKYAAAVPEAQWNMQQARREADEKAAANTRKLMASTANDLMPEARQLAVTRAAGGTPPPSTMGQGPARIARDEQFREDIKGPPQQWRQGWRAQRDDLLAGHMDEQPDLAPLHEGIQEELSRWQGRAPYSSRVSNLLNDSLSLGNPRLRIDTPEGLDRVQDVLREIGWTKRHFAEYSPEEQLAAATNALWDNPRPVTVRDLLSKQAEANRIASVSKGADKTAAEAVSRAADDTLAHVIPTPELKQLNSQYWNHRLQFPHSFERTINETERPVDAAKDIFDHPQRALDLIDLGDASTRRALGQLYAQWVGENGERVIDPSHAPFLAKLYGKPFHNPQAWVYLDKATDHLADVINSSPQVRAKWETAVRKGMADLKRQYAKSRVEQAFKDAKQLGPLGQRLTNQLRQAAGKGPEAQAEIADRWFSALSPELAERYTARGQTTPEQAGITAIQERGYKPTRLAATAKWRIPSTVAGTLGGIAMFGHPTVWALGLGAWEGTVGARELLVKAAQESLRDPTKARAFYQAIQQPGIPSNFNLLATAAARAGMATTLERAGVDTSALARSSAAPTYAGSATAYPTDNSEAARHLDMSRAEHLAPTPSASDRALTVGKRLSMGRVPEVHRDLNSGRLSMDETNRILRNVSSSDPMATIADIPLSEALDAAEAGDAREKRFLLPLIKQRMMKEFSGSKYNRTLAANLAARYRRAMQSIGAAA